MRLWITGSTGLIGRHLAPAAEEAGWRLGRLVRKEPVRAGEAFWDPAAGRLDEEALGRVDALVHLAGASISGGRWTAARKRLIMESRVKGTALLAECLAQRPPGVWISASGVHIYGHQGDAWVTEESPAEGEGFLAEVCRAWEAATEPARRAGWRVVRLRLGVVLAAGGGALPLMALPFRLGVGGRIGGGRQFLSWISIEDAVGAILHLLQDDRFEGPVNACSPEPATNLEFTKALARILRRPALVSVPAAAVRALLGQMGEELILHSLRVRPERLLAGGYLFRRPRLELALRAALGRA